MDFEEDFSSLARYNSVKNFSGRNKGSGSFGSVFEVEIEDQQKSQDVVYSHKPRLICKRLHDILLGRGNETCVSPKEKKCIVSKFVQECVTLSRLKHRNVVAFHSIHIGPDGKAEGDINLIMEALASDLYQVSLAPTGPKLEFSLAKKQSLLRDVSCGLKYLHDMNIIHRDLNPGNILFSEGFTMAKIADLGCSRYFEASYATSPMTVCPGAQIFMPPEALDEKNTTYDFKLDCFSFGNIVLALWNHKLPIATSRVTVDDVVNNQQEVGRRRSLFECLEGFPDLYDLVKLCLSDTSGNRPSSEEILQYFNKKIGGCLLNTPSSLKVQPLHGDNILAIDFGSSSIRVSHLHNNTKPQQLPINKEYNSYNLPNSIFIKNKAIADIHDVELGQRALNEYHDQLVQSSDMSAFIFYQMNQPQNHNTNQAEVTGSNGLSYPVVNVISVILMHIKGKIETDFGIDVQSCHWVLAVPKGSMAMFREAAALAGFSSTEDAIELPLHPAHTFRNIIPKSLDNVSLLFKSEAAATGVIAMRLDQDGFPHAGSCGLVVDVGEGTIGVSMFEYRNGKYHLLDICNQQSYKGGRTVTEAFLKYLTSNVVSDENFSLYLQNSKIENNADFMVCLVHSFKQAAIKFVSSEDSNDSPYFTIDLPQSFYEIYEEKLLQLHTDGPVTLNRRRRTLRITYLKFEEFLSTLLDNIKAAIDATLTAVATDQPSTTIDDIYLVGGYGGSQYVFDKINSFYSTHKVKVPGDANPLYATVLGACHYFNQQIQIHSSKSPAHYGIVCAVPYNPTSNPSHNEDAKILGEDDQYYCSSVFIPLLQKDELIDPWKQYQCVLTPLFNTQTVLPVSLYCTSQDDLGFVMDPKTGDIPNTMKKIATLDVNIEAGINTLSLNERQVLVSVRFRRYDVEISATYNGHDKISTISTL